MHQTCAASSRSQISERHCWTRSAISRKRCSLDLEASWAGASGAATHFGTARIPWPSRGLCPARFLISRDHRWTKDYDEQHLFTPSGVGHFDRGLYPTHWESGRRGSAIAARSTTDLDRHGEDWGNKNGSAQFDRAMLEALGTVSFSTHTPWYKEPVTFEGVPLVRLLDLLEVHGDTLIAVALNDYTTEIPITDAAKYGPILALKRNGEYMPVRDKGPIFIVYNYDSNSDLRSQKFYSRSAWQVTRIEIK